MTQIAAIQVSETDVWWIVDQLFAIGRADDVTAAFAIENGVLAGEPIDELTPGQQAAILEAVSYVNARLDPLREALERHHCRRTRGAGLRHPGGLTLVGSRPGGVPFTALARTLLQRIHNPHNRTCGCDRDCWCRRTAIGRAVKWWFPGRCFGLYHKSRGLAAWNQTRNGSAGTTRTPPSAVSHNI